MHRVITYSTVLSIALSVVVLSGCTPPMKYVELLPSSKANYATGDVTIRVLLDSTVSSFTYQVGSPVLLANEQEAIALIKRGNTITFSARKNLVEATIAGKSFMAPVIALRSEDPDSLLLFKGKRYSRELLLAVRGQRLLIINRLPLEEYLQGVLPLELGFTLTDSIREAVKAFAVCARTFAVMKLQMNNPLFDVTADTRDQLFGGAGSARADYNELIAQTSGEIVTYNDLPAQVFYHSSCGGITEDSRNVFGKTEIPYLTPVVDGTPPNCRFSNSFEWEEAYDAQELFTRLQSVVKGIEGDALRSIKITKRTASGRVDEMVFRLTNDKVYSLRGRDIRQFFRSSARGGAMLRSLSFELEIAMEGEALSTVVIKGKGNGHGVGLCQWGALQLSKQGSSAEAILGFYLPGTQTVRLHDWR